MTYSFI